MTRGCWKGRGDVRHYVSGRRGLGTAAGSFLSLEEAADTSEREGAWFGPRRERAGPAMAGAGLGIQYLAGLEETPMTAVVGVGSGVQMRAEEGRGRVSLALCDVPAPWGDPSR
ncbi:hypothetical protein chiPu_0022660 [Chiloscyllium punctatum]|uniref:Uncharacterized protein n=1 Tax=Chiloscyllium punctatum TaxID=137246 RepID=A0A401RJC1_CHIPU|nr:hypothetical protein [Chiloscyllium punctatum]